MFSIREKSVDPIIEELDVRCGGKALICCFKSLINTKGFSRSTKT